MRWGILLTSCAALAGVAQADTVNVEVRNNLFRVTSAVPGQGTDLCTINRGDTVVWNWIGVFHSVTSDTPGLFDSGIQNAPFTFQHTFDTAGLVAYHCSLHGTPGFGMFGTIDVVAPPCPGDVDGNNQVNIEDLTTLLSNYGTLTGATLADGDMNGDGDVDLEDLTFLLSRYGTSC